MPCNTVVEICELLWAATDFSVINSNEKSISGGRGKFAIEYTINCFEKLKEYIKKEAEKSEIVKKIDKEHKLITDLLSILVQMQSDHTFYRNNLQLNGANYDIEDSRNRLVRLGLSILDYYVLDQTQRGYSPEGKKSGELDLFVMEEKLPLTVIEGLNLTCLDKGKIQDHLDKLFTYDTAGNPFNVVIAYVDVNDNNKLCNDYENYISTEHKWKKKLISTKKEELNKSNIQLYISELQSGEFRTKIYHFLIFFPQINDK